MGTLRDTLIDIARTNVTDDEYPDPCCPLLEACDIEKQAVIDDQPKEKPMNKLCSICGMEIDVVPGWRDGHNAQPINDGRCCSACNSDIVIPRRLIDCARRNTGDRNDVSE